MKKTREQISHNMSRVRSSGSAIEALLGRAMWAAGLRYRKQYSHVPGRPDFAIVHSKIAVFCDSAFWHGRNWTEAAKTIKSNRGFWIPKIERNIARDKAVNRALRARGWAVLRFWDDQIIAKAPQCAKRVLNATNEAKKVNTTTATVAIDFFCGAGGMTNGLLKAGLHVLAGVDNEPLCERTYRQNKNRDGSRPEFICKDIFPRTKAHPGGQQEEIRLAITRLLSDFRKKSGIRRPRLVFAICAPCQPFTRITKIEMSEGRQFKRDNDSNLLLTTVGLIRNFKPDAIICENVEGLVNDDPSGVISSFRRRLTHAGYVFDAKIVNASKFGVPQNRRRTIGLALLRKRYGSELEVADKDLNMRAPRTVAETIGHLPALAAGESDSDIPNHRARGLSDLNLKRIACAVPGESNLALRDTPYGDLSLGCHQRLEKRAGAQSFADTYTRMRGDSVAPTITTKCMSITNGRFGHYDRRQNRAITPREAALLQTFPERYVFYPEDSLDFTATLIGNAVPPTLARFFGKFVVQRIATYASRSARRATVRYMIKSL